MYDTVKQLLCNKHTPSHTLTMVITQKFAQRLEHVNTSLRGKIYHIKQSVCKKQKPLLGATTKTSASDPIDPHAF